MKHYPVEIKAFFFPMAIYGKHYCSFSVDSAAGNKSTDMLITVWGP